MSASPANPGLNREAQHSIADEHRLLAESIDRAALWIGQFFSAPPDSRASEAAKIAEFLSELIELAKAHFEHEEDLMKKSEFPGFIIHKRDHDYLIRSLMHFASSLGHGTVPVSSDIGVNLRSWLTFHIKKYDEAYAAFAESAKRDAAARSATHGSPPPRID